MPEINDNVLRTKDLALHVVLGSDGILFNDKVDKRTEAVVEDAHALEGAELLELLLQLFFRHVGTNVPHP